MPVFRPAQLFFRCQETGILFLWNYEEDRALIRKFLLSSASAFILTGSAIAADLPTSAPPPVYVPPVPIFTWTGIYVGGQIGYEWGKDTRISYSSAGVGFVEPQITSNGVAGGAHAGFNYQVKSFVFGLEGSLDGTSLKGNALNNTGTALATTSRPVEGSIRGRLGFAFDRVLIYATGGLAIADQKATSLNLLNGSYDTFATSKVGWTVGGGIEYAITNNWSIRAEYRYTDYGNVTDFDYFSTRTFAGGPYTTRKRVTDNLVQAGFSYKFDLAPPPGPIVAKY